MIESIITNKAFCAVLQVVVIVLFLSLNLFQATSRELLWNERDVSETSLTSRNYASDALRDDSTDGFIRDFKASKKRICIHADLLNYETGGPEAMIQLALAFNELLPGSTHLCHTWGGRLHPIGKRFHTEYPSVTNLTVLHRQELRKGDVFIMPEYRAKCDEELVERGVTQFVWILAATHYSRIVQLVSKGCGVVSHNHFLRDKLGYGMPYLLRPYLSPSLVRNAPTQFVPRSERIVWINPHGNPKKSANELQKICNSALLNCTAKIVEGFARDELPAAYSRGTVVFDNCLVGSERVVLESSIHGNIFVTTDCLCGSDERDFPIPKRNLLPNGNWSFLPQVLDRIFKNYEAEWNDYEALRSLYRDDLNHQSLVKEARQFLYDIHNGSITQS